MAVTQNGGGFLAGKFYGALGDGGAEDIVEPGIAFDFFLSGGVRQDDVVILILAGHGETLGVEDSDYLTGEVFYADNFTDGIFHAKELLAHGGANVADVRGTFNVIVGEGGAQVDIPTFDVKEFRGDAAIRGKPIMIAINNLHVIIDVTINRFDKTVLIFNRPGVRHGNGRHPVSG